MITRREMFSAAAGPLLGRAAQSKRPPNIVWMMADDLGPYDLGCYGQRYIRTPNIDRLASEGMLFAQAYAGCTVCAPSRSVLMTGLHMGHTPVRSNPGGVPILAGETTVADLLQSAGYATGLFGKWGLGDIGTEGVPWKHGFDEFFGFLHQAHAHFQYPRFLYANEKEYRLEGNSDTSRVTYGNDVMAEKAVDFVRRKKDRPFFLYYSPTVPHFEPHVPEDSMAEYRGKFPMGKPWSEASGRQKAQPDLRSAHAGMVTRLDGYVGRILAQLKEQGLERDTLVVFTSDNGGYISQIDNFFESNGKLRGNKGSMYEGGLRAPMITRWPGRIGAGKRSDFAWYFADFMPTACELAGVRKLPRTDGISVVPALVGGRQVSHDEMYWELPRYNSKTAEFLPDSAPMQALRRGNLKGVRAKADAVVEVYDLAADPSETNDLAKAKPELAAEFDKRMRAARTPPRTQKEPPHPWWEARS